VVTHSKKNTKQPTTFAANADKTEETQKMKQYTEKQIQKLFAQTFKQLNNRTITINGEEYKEAEILYQGWKAAFKKLNLIQ